MSEKDNNQTSDCAPDVLRLSLADATSFAEALMSPPEPNARMFEAAQRYLKTMRR